MLRPSCWARTINMIAVSLSFGSGSKSIQAWWGNKTWAKHGRSELGAGRCRFEVVSAAAGWVGDDVAEKEGWWNGDMYLGSPTLSMSIPIAAPLKRHAASVGGAPCGQRAWPGRLEPIIKARSSDVGERRFGTSDS